MMKKIILLLLLYASYSNGQNSCSEALPVTAGLYTVSIIDGTQGITAPCSGGTGADNAEWYVYTPSVNKVVTVSTDLAQNTCGDTRIQVYRGTCSGFVCVDGDDDSGSILCPDTNFSYLSKVTFDALVGNTYYIAFDNQWESDGFDFQISESEYVEPTPQPVTFTPTAVNLQGTYRECVVDMNGDYLDDLVGVSQNSLNILYQNASGNGFNSQVINVPQITYLPNWSSAAGDYNKDGFNDLVLGGSQGVSFLRSNGNGTSFNHFATQDYVFSQRSNFVDLNNDGHLDAFVCHDVAPNVFYINDGNGNLQFNQGGIGDYPSGGHYGSLWTDYDNDGDVDMFMAKCGGEVARRTNQLFRNNGNGTFTDVAPEAGLADPIQTWSGAVADYDNDGDMDILVGASSFSDGGHKLMRNNGDGTFTNITTGTGWENNTNTSIEHVAYDFDNNGFVDVMGGGNTIMFNNGDMTFTPQVYSSVGVGAMGDLNNDGFIDILNQSTVNFNSGNDNNWLKLTFNGVQSNKNGIGARIEIFGAWGKQIREVRSGEGFAFMSSLNVHFGLGTATTIDQVVVRWPSGVVDTFNNVPINQTLNVTEGSTLAVNEFSSNGFVIYPVPSKDIINIQLLGTTNAEIEKVEIFDLNGKKVLETKSSSQQMNINQLSIGSYIMVVKDTNKNVLTQKFSKN